MVVISYAILTHNEGKVLDNLLKFLFKNIDVEDLIVIVDDYSDDLLTIKILKKHSTSAFTRIRYRALDDNFAAQKNFLFDLCSGDYIFNLDADEMITPLLIYNIKIVLLKNPLTELF